jgi:site-specific recombinase
MFESFSRWRRAGRARRELDSLLEHTVPQASLVDRLEWVDELFRWLRSEGAVALPTVDYKTGQLQATRVRYLLLQLEKNIEWKKAVAQTFRSILRDTSALDLFCVTGLPAESGFLSESLDRVMERVLPRPLHEKDLGELFCRIFPSVDDVNWLERIDAQHLDAIWALFIFESTPQEEAIWSQLKADMEDAFFFLTGQVRSFGLAPRLRRRMSGARLRNMPFFEITHAGRQLMKDFHYGDANSFQESVLRFREVLKNCRWELDQAHEHLEEFGVSISIVYQLDRIESIIVRIETLLEILLGRTKDPRAFVKFLCSLIRELHQKSSLGSFFGENLSLISMKIAERSAETGDHYITRDAKGYYKMFRKAAGGGAITSLTALLKVFIDSFSLSYFFVGVFSSINYAVSFVAIHVAGFTLATKQPAMTANALAAKMQDLGSQQARTNLVDEVVNLMRSQGAAVFGNVSMVIPFAVFFSLALYYVRGIPLMSRDEAMGVIEAHSLLGLSPLHAIFTGFLLWFSSIAAGWIDNWSVYREIPEALASNRRLKNFLGPSRLQRWVNAYKKHLAAWAGNITLGVLLGMAPKIISFVGLPLDVRHVTLGTGTVAFAASSIGLEVLLTWSFWLAALGLVSIGLMNVGVSFFLALLVALKSRRIQAALRDEVYSEVMQRFRSSPRSFFFPPKEVKEQLS